MQGSDVAVWSCSRIASARCPNKMIRPFHGTTLTDILLSKLARLEGHVFFAGYEDVFEEKCRSHGVPFVRRTERSARVDAPAAEIYSFLNDQPYRYGLQVNACVPFLKTRTISAFLDACLTEDRPAFGVFRVKNYFVHTDGRPINFDDTLSTINTKAVPPLYEFAHVFYFFSLDYFRRTGWYWDWRELRYIEVPEGLETFDIDTEEQFVIAETLWKTLGDTVV